MAKSDVIFGSEFSPAVIDSFANLLELIHEHQPNRRELQRAIDKRFFAGKGKNADPRKTLGDNTILAMIAYGIIERENKSSIHFTEFGQDLYEHRNDDQKLRDLMGRQCLARLAGVRVISSIQDLMRANIPLKKENIAKRLREEGLHVPTNGKHLNILRQWLEYAGALNATGATGGDALWTPNEDRIRQLIGVTSTDIEQWSELTKPQYDFARAFALMGADTATSSEVRDMAISLYASEFPEGGLPQSVLHRLEEVGLITWEKTTTGRGAKAHKVFATKKLRSEFLGPILEQIATTMGHGYKRLARMSLTEIIQDLDRADKHRKGIALEALAFYFFRRLDLSFVQWRLRGKATGGAEVDMVVEGTRLMFSRWQIQCKNCVRVATEDLAREVGIATTIRSNVVMLISTGEVGGAVRAFAKKVMENTALHVIMLSGEHLRAIADNPAKLTILLNEQAGTAMTIKRVQLTE